MFVYSVQEPYKLLIPFPAITDPIAQAHDFVDLCNLFGFYAEEHVVQTEDGYLLGIHRLAWRHGEEDQRINTGPGSLQKKVVYLHHGLMMNSEVWVCLTEKERSLPFLLVEKGYDVWLGNNRGNKYSKKSVSHSPASNAFWNFSIDQFAFHDIPDTINYILETTSRASLSYIGFSQGTAQAFATLSIHPTLNDKVDVFVALAPAMSPPGLANGIVASLVKTNPEVLYLAFGRRSLLNSTTMWQALLYPPIFVRSIDLSLSFLFGWHAKNITPHQKLAAYPHLFSFTSTKSVVHWFQIIRNKTFQMHDDEVQGPLSVADGKRYYKVAKFPTRNIRTPIVLAYGGSDSLVDIDAMLKELPKHTVAVEIPHYEHLDFLWADDVAAQVFPHVLDALEFNARLDGAKAKDPRDVKPVMRPQSAAGPQPPSYSEDERVNPKSPRGIGMRGAIHRKTIGSGSTDSDRGVTSLDERNGSDSSTKSSFSLESKLLERSPSGASISSHASTDTHIGAGGITIGAGKAAGSVLDREASGTAVLDGRSHNNKKKGRRK